MRQTVLCCTIRAVQIIAEKLPAAIILVLCCVGSGSCLDAASVDTGDDAGGFHHVNQHKTLAAIEAAVERAYITRKYFIMLSICF